MKRSLGLVTEESKNLSRLANNSRIGLKHALYALGQIAQIENVVRLGRRRQKIGTHASIDLDARRDDAVAALFDGRRKLGEKSVHDRLEYVLETLLVRRRYAERIEVTKKTRRHRIATAAGRRARRAHDRVLNDFPEELVAIVKAAEVLILSQKFDRRLRSVPVQFRHVEIVDEDDDAFVLRRTEDVFSFLLQIRLDDGLRAFAARLRRKVDRDGDEVLRDHVVQLSLGYDGLEEEQTKYQRAKLVALSFSHLSDACSSSKENRLVDFDQAFEEKAEANRVDRRNEKFEIRNLGVIN